MAEHQKDESSTLVYDTASRSKFYGISPLQLLAYMLGHQPWAISTSREIKDGHAGFVDTEWTRDSHAVLVKQKNTMKKKHTRYVVKILADYLDDEEIEIILQRLLKRTATMEERRMRKKMMLLKILY